MWGPYKTATFDGNNFFLIIVDDHCRLTWIYLLKNKPDCFSCLQKFTTYAEKQFGTHVKTVRTDNGSEYFNHSLELFFASKGIRYDSSLHTPTKWGGRKEA